MMLGMMLLAPAQSHAGASSIIPSIITTTISARCARNLATFRPRVAGAAPCACAFACGASARPVMPVISVSSVRATLLAALISTLSDGARGQ
jgi:hypothetical protein